MLHLTSSLIKRSNTATIKFSPELRRGFRSPAALETLNSKIFTDGCKQENPILVLYNYPSFSGSFAALFAHLYHSALNLPFIVLPFSSVDPLRVSDFRFCGIETCYMLDFIGPKNFAGDLAKIIPRVIAFDHRVCTLSRISDLEKCPNNLELRVDTRKSSARASLEYFSEKFIQRKSLKGDHEALLNLEDQVRVEKMIKYIEDADLRRWELAGTKEFAIGIRQVGTKLNFLTNPHAYEKLLELDADELIAKGNSYVASRHDAANRLLTRPFKIRLGRGLYGECLAVRADGNGDLSHEIAVELSRMSAAAGLRPIGAVIFMQRGNLKMCLRTTDSTIDTSEIAKTFGGGGKPSSSSFIIRMDEYNEWTAVNSL